MRTVQTVRVRRPVHVASGKLRRSTVAQGWKAKRAANGDCHCDSCGFVAGPELVEAFPEWWSRLLHAHHVIPLAFGGLDKRSNLVLLCPTCHALAHLLGRGLRSGGLYTWIGPADRWALLEAMEVFYDTDFDAKVAPDATRASLFAPIEERQIA